MRSAARPGAATASVTVSDVVVNETAHGLDVGSVRLAAVIAAAPARSAFAAPDAIGRVRASDDSSGMQIFSHTIQLACPRSVTRVPGFRSGPTVIGIGRTTSPV